jgi:DnaJ family protein C protein 28
MANSPRKRRPWPEDDEQRPTKPSSTGKPPAEWRDVAEEAIEEAIRSGVFDDLPGRGKPLNLINNPYAPGTELAYQMLKDNQYTLPWISERSSLLAQIQEMRADIAASWTAYRGQYRIAVDDNQRLTLAQEWMDLLALWEERIAGLNKEISTLNLKQPGNQLEILKLTINSELERASARRTLG